MGSFSRKLKRKMEERLGPNKKRKNAMQLSICSIHGPYSSDDLCACYDEKGHMNVDDADGNDWWEVLDSEDDLPVWKAKVAAHGDGSTVVFSKGLNRWMPRSGPWADAARKYRQAKSAFLSKPLFELRKVTRNQLRGIIREVLEEDSDTPASGEPRMLP